MAFLPVPEPVTLSERSGRSVGIYGEGTAGGRVAAWGGRCRGPPVPPGITRGGAGAGRPGAGVDDRRCAAGRPGKSKPGRHRRLRAGLGLGSLRGGGLCRGLAQAGQPARLDPPDHRGVPRAQRGCQLLHGGRLPAPAWRAAAGLAGPARAARLGTGTRAVRAGHPALPRRQAAVTTAAADGVGLCRGSRRVDRCGGGHHGGRDHRPPHSGGSQR